MTYMQRMGADGLIPAKFAHIFAVGNQVGYFAPWTGEKRFGDVVKNNGDVVVIKDHQSMTRYQYEIVRN